MTAALADTSSPRTFLGVRILTPENCKVFRGVYSLLHVAIPHDEQGIGTYRAIHSVRAFPATSPDRYIALRYPDENGFEQEIGIIIELRAFPEEAQALIRESLAGHYFEYIVRRIYSVEWKFNLLFFDVETTQGRVQFQMRWQVDRTQDYGENSKVLLDVMDDRYIIPDLRELPRKDRDRFTRYIYW